MLRRCLPSKASSRTLFNGAISVSFDRLLALASSPLQTFGENGTPPAPTIHNRHFATKSIKKALKEQREKYGTLLEEAEELKMPLPQTAPPPTPRPPKANHMIRTDFENKDLVLPDIPTNIAAAHVDYKELYDPQVHLPSAPQDWSDYEPATPLWHELAAQIGVTGRPLTVAEYISQCLMHPEFGYYSQPNRMEEDSDEDLFSDDDESDNPIFGPQGDFVTAPEISTVFGDSIQVWMVTQWEAMGKPGKMQWVEFGPGRGTLMADMVRFALTHHDSKTTNSFAEYGKALQVIHFIEQSPTLRAQQEASLRDKVGHLVHWKFRTGSDDVDVEETTTTTKPTIEVHWHECFAHLSALLMKQKQDMPLFVVCQEFFDALPVHAFERTKEEGWRERMVDMAIRDDMLEDEDGNIPTTHQPMEGQKRPRLRIVLAPEVTPAVKTLLHVDDQGNFGDNDQEGQVVEVCPEGILLVQDIAALLQLQGGAALIVDYGGDQGSRDSVRGFWKHKQTHFLSLPGQTDVTADVDFMALKHAVNSRRVAPQKDDATKVQRIKAYGPVPQGKFLASMGATERVIQAIESDATSDEEAENLCNALETLVSEEKGKMGKRYKVLAIAAERKDKSGSFTVPPAGF